jgi:hypothetical protein
LEGEKFAHQIVENAKQKRNEMAQNAAYEANQELAQLK